MDIGYYKKLCEEDYFERFEIFRKFLIESNEKFNLTSITDKKDVYLKHFIDSAVGEKFFKKDASVAEIGSGGGFPSIPLKIIRDDLSFTLIESTSKKCQYLGQLIDILKLDGVRVINSRAEELAKNVKYREKYDAVVARAVARLNTLSEYCLPFLKLGGVFIAYKGVCDEEITEAETAVEILGGKIEIVEKYCLDGGEGRSLIVIKKVKPTPLKYPRGQGKERKNPIV